MLVILILTRLVKTRISEAMVGTKGAIVHDGWTHNGMLFFGVSASFMREVPVLRNGIDSKVHETACRC